MNEKTKAAWFLDADFTPTSTLVERLRLPERVVVNDAGFTMLFSSSDKLEAADRIEQLEAIMRKLVEPFKASKLLFGAQHLRSVRVGDQVVEELLAAMEGKDD